MSVVNVTNVIVGGNPAGMLAPFEFEVHFECLEPLDQDIEWKMIYVGDVNNKEESDQELDCIALGPIQRGIMKFNFVADPPDYQKIPYDEIPGITVILLTGSYRGQEFVRIGYFVHNVIVDPELQEEIPDEAEVPLQLLLSKMQRVILADEPRITRFNIDWDRPNPELQLPCELIEGDLSLSQPIQTGEDEAPQGAPTSADGNMTNSADEDVAMQPQSADAALQKSYLGGNWTEPHQLGEGSISVSSTAAPSEAYFSSSSGYDVHRTAGRPINTN